MTKYYLKKALLLQIFVLISCLIFAQQRTVTGKVLDPDGYPLQNVTVTVKDAKSATVTNQDGTFSIAVPSNQSVLRFSHVGFVFQEHNVGSKTTFQIKLKKDDAELQDVVVVGYGTQKRIHLTGAVASLDVKSVTDLPVGNLSEALRGMSPGVNVSGGFARPGQVATIQVRNPTFYSKDGGSKDPIYVIDDIIRTKADFDLLDATEVESISVLKDAAAAVYGIIGSNGAIVVRTKKGKNGAPQISYNGSYGNANATQMPKMMTGFQQAQYLNDYNAGSKNWDTTSTYALAGYYTPDEMAFYQTHNWNWLPMAWQSAYDMRHALNISGGAEKATYFAGITYNENNSNFPGLGFKRYGFRSSSDIKLSHGLKLGLSVSGSLGSLKNTFNKQGSENLDNDWQSLVNMPQFLPPYINGMPILLPGTTSASIYNYHYFAVHSLDNYTSTYNSSLNFQGQLSYDIPFIKGLRAAVNFNKNIANTWGKQYGTKYNVYQFSPLGNHGHILDTTSGAMTQVSTTTFSNGNRVRITPSIMQTYQLNATLNYNRSFGKHEISALFAYEQVETSTDGVAAEVDDPIVGGLDNMNFATTMVLSNEPITETGRLAYVGRINYNYASKYLLELIYRADGSVNFAPENRWGYFPSGSIGWVASEEPFFKRILPKVNYLKFRASVGLLGLDATKPYQWLRSFAIQTGKAAVMGSGNSDMGVAVVTNVDMANRGVHWDNVNKYNVGIDAKFFNNRLSISADAYLDKRFNMLSALTSSPSILIGTVLPSQNFAKLNNFGTEWSATWRDRINRNWGFYVNATYYWFDDKQIKVDQAVGNIGTYLDKTGKPTDMGYLGYHALGMFRTQSDVDAWLTKYPGYTEFGNAPKPGMLILQDVRGPQVSGQYTAPDGIITTADQTYLKKRSSNHNNVGLNWGVNYKSLSLSVLMGISWGGIQTVDAIQKGTSFLNRPAFWADHWTPTNTNAQNPSPYYDYSYNIPTDFWWKSSTSFRMNNFNLAYMLPGKYYSKLGMTSAKVYLIGTNPLNFYNPYNYKDNANSSYSVYPTLRTFTFGVNFGL